MRYGECDVAVIGGGPAGLAAATAAAYRRQARGERRCARIAKSPLAA